MALGAHQSAGVNAADERVTGSIVGELERPVLIWLAKKMPAWVSPDILTFTGLAGAGVSCAGYVFSNFSPAFLWLASFGLIVHWFGDSLDGTLARVRRKERPRYGFLLDHSVDLAAQMTIAVGAGASPFIHFDIALISLILFLAFTALSVMKTVALGEMQISYGGIGPTEVRCVLIAINTVVFWHSPQPIMVLWEPMSPVDLFFLAASGVAAVALVISAVTALRAVARDETRT